MTWGLKTFAAAAALAFAPVAANAAFINVSGGSAGSIPGSGTVVNDALDAIAELPPSAVGLTGIYGAQLVLTEAATLDFSFYGGDGQFVNEFEFSGEVIFTHQGNVNEVLFSNSLAAPLSTASRSQFGPGDIDFLFRYNVLSVQGSVVGTIENGSNPDDVLGTSDQNFFIHMLGEDDYLVFLDDGGKQNDDNHDDMVVRIQARKLVVSEPGALGLIGLGILGLGFYARRRQS